MLNSKLKFENKNKMAEPISRKKYYRNGKSFSIFLRNVVLRGFFRVAKFEFEHKIRKFKIADQSEMEMETEL